MSHIVCEPACKSYVGNSGLGKKRKKKMMKFQHIFHRVVLVLYIHL